MARGIDKFYRRASFELVMFGHINALSNSLPSLTIEKAALNFLDFYKLSEDDWSLNSILKTFSRMKKEYFESERTQDES